MILNLDFSIDERKINSQLAIKKIIEGNCFSNDYATIDEKRYNLKNLTNCYGQNNDILVRLRLNGESLYTDESEFNSKAKKCSTTSTLKCSEMRYPILYQTENKKEIKELTIQIITN